MAGQSKRSDERFKSLVEFSYWALLAAGIAFTLLVFSLRLWSVVSLQGLVPTSGVEGAGSFGVYQVCIGRVPYHDFTVASNIAVFNFVFYELYGLLVGLFGPCDVATPLIGRLLTVLLLSVLAVAIYLARDKRLYPLEAAMIALGVFSSYFGWWAFALRPDVGAATFFALCIITMLFYLSNPKLWIALLVGFFLLCSWGFKQPYAFAGPILLWYIFRRNPRHALAFCFTVMVGIAIPFAAYGIRPYFLHTVYAEGSAPFVASIGVSNLVSFLVKGSPTLILAGLVIVACRKGGLDSGRAFLLVMLIVSFPILAISSSKGGAADNYYFPTFVVASILAVRHLQSCDPLVRRIGMAVSATLSIVLALVVLSGYRGTTTLSPSAREIREVADQLNRMPPPKLIWEEAVALPWFTKDVETRILWIREGNALVKEGFDPHKSVAEGHYQTVAIPDYSKSSFDLSRYQLIKTIDSLQIYALRH